VAYFSFRDKDASFSDLDIREDLGPHPRRLTKMRARKKHSNKSSVYPWRSMWLSGRAAAKAMLCKPRTPPQPSVLEFDASALVMAIDF
jgi:hypothetical protein